MKKIFIPHDKWINVYNSIILLLFFCNEYKNHPESNDAINERLNSFCTENKIIWNNFRFEGGENSLSFCYLIIVRIIEIVNIAVGSDGGARKQFFKDILATAKQSGFISFDDITTKYCFDIRTFAYNKKPDEEKLYQLFRHIRHSISHYSYEIDSSDKVSFKSIDPKSKTTELDMTVPMFQVLNLTAEFGKWVNNTLHQKNLLAR